jgi:flagellar hook protein FlgE
MFASIYTSLAGMKAYSQGLDVISNNVANLNTPGFKVSDPVFREIVYRHIQANEGNGGGQRPQGSGVEAGSASINFAPGEPRDTGNPLDVAIDGSGFFVLQQEGNAYRYTRAGQFTFNNEGVLVERTTGEKVLFSTAESSVGSFDINSFRTHEPRATSKVTIGGVLARTGTNATYEMTSATVYDKAGTAVPLRVRFTRHGGDPLRWTAEVITTSANTVVGSGTLTFNADGTPAVSTFTVTVSAVGGEGFPVTFDLGAAGTYSGVTSPPTSTSHSLNVQRQDGLTIGSLTTTSFDEQGQLKLAYSNGQSKTVGKLVLAQFDNPEQLQVLGGGMFALKDGMSERLGGAMAQGVGRIMGGRIEMANVDLTRQFTDLIILQRGYQASSQVSSITNELIQTLLAMGSGR